MLGISAGRPRTALKAELSHEISSKIPLCTRSHNRSSMSNREELWVVVYFFFMVMPFKIQSFFGIKIKVRKKTRAGKQHSAHKLSCWSGCRQELRSQISAPRAAGRISIPGSLCLWGSVHFSASPFSLALPFVQGFTGSPGQAA